MVVNGTSNVVNYGTCSTAAATAAKVVSCSNFALITGAEITVKFTTTNTAANPTLNVNSTGAKDIYYRGSAISAGYLAANRTYTFRYNGTQYELVGDLNTDTKNTAGSTDTSSKIYLIGATSQGANPQTYSHDTVYVDSGGRVVSNGYCLGLDDPFFKTGLKTSKSYTFPAETSKTYYVTLKSQSSFDKQKFMFRTTGDNTNHITLAIINARPYMEATIYGQTLRYNGPEISQIAVYKNTTASYKHDIVLTVKTNPKTTTTLYVNSNDNFDLSSECISTTAPTGALEASFAPSYDDRLFTTGPIYAGGGFTGNLSGNASTATKLATARTIALTGSITGSGTFDGSGNLSIATTTNHTHSYLPLSGGTVTGDLTIQKTSTISANSPATLNFKTVQSDNNVTSSAYIRVYDDHDTNPHGTNMVIQSAGNIIIGSGESPSACYSTDLINSASENMYITSDNNIYFYTNCNTYADKKTSVYINNAGALYGAVWNDYAEFRICKDNFKPGQVVLENGDDTLSIASQRLQRGCSIISDTFGFAIGETDEAKCPIAVSGRVLAYGYESREEFKKHIGWPVCSGPNGTVSIMTEEEEEKYPSRIIGTISAVPDYETWGTGNVSVNGRIWIKIR